MGRFCEHIINCKGNPKCVKRFEKAQEQSILFPTSYELVYNYVNDFIEVLRCRNNCIDKITRKELINLSGKNQMILNNGIIIRNYTWNNSSKEDKEIYKSIRKKFNNENIIWLKFTEKGHLGVVGQGEYINFDNHDGKRKVCSYYLLDSVEDAWDKFFVFVFPITDEIKGRFSIKCIKRLLVSYLKMKGVTIIDYYSDRF